MMRCAPETFAARHYLVHPAALSQWQAQQIHQQDHPAPRRLPLASSLKRRLVQVWLREPHSLWGLEGVLKLRLMWLQELCGLFYPQWRLQA